MKTAVIYARYSCSSQTEQSIEGQIRVCTEYAERNDLVVVDTYIDRAMSGTNDNRTAFQKMLKDSNKRAWDIVLVYKLDRFSRNKYETAMHKKTLRDNGIKLVSAMENIPDTPEGIILESLLEGMAEYYSAELSQKVKRGLNESRQKGNFTGGYLLFGYRKDGKKLVIEENEASVIRQVFLDCANGKMVKTIIEELRQKGILCRGKPFARNTVYKMLSNEKYNGVYRYGDQVFTDIYPKIVDDDLFESVRTKMEANKYGKHKPDVIYLLKNKITCGYCGSKVHSDAGTSRSGTVMRYYKCSGKRKDHTCTLNQFRKEQLEEFVLDAVIDAFSTPEHIEILATEVLKYNQKRIADQSILNLLISEQAENEKALNNVLKAIEMGVCTVSTKERLELLEQKKIEIADKIAYEKSQTKLALTKEEVVDYLDTAMHKCDRLTIDMLVREIKLYNDHMEVYCRFSHGSDENYVLYQGFSFYSKTVKCNGKDMTITLNMTC